MNENQFLNWLLSLSKQDFNNDEAKANRDLSRESLDKQLAWYREQQGNNLTLSREEMANREKIAQEQASAQIQAEILRQAAETGRKIKELQSKAGLTFGTTPYKLR